MSEEDVPEGRCGFVQKPKNLKVDPVYFYGGDERWHKERKAVCCWRESWGNNGHCIWHAKVNNKPIIELTDSRLDGAERLDGAHLQEAKISGSVSFANCGLWGADFGKADMQNVDFTGATLRKADLSETNISEVDFETASLPFSKFENTTVRNTDFESSDLRFIEAEGANFSHVDFTGANLEEALFTDAHFFKTDFTESHMRDALLDGASLHDVTLDHGNLKGVNLNDSELPFSSLVDSSFRGANLRGANLEHSSIAGASLYNTDLTDANLRNADLKAATLENAILTRTDLRGANLEYAELYQTLFSDIRMNNRTEFGETCQYEARDIEPQIGGDDSDVTPLEAAAWTYRRIQTLHEENALAQNAREYHVKKAEAYRKLRWREFADIWSKPHRDPRNWFTTLVHALTYSINGRVSHHGESPHHVVGVSLLVIFGSAILYPLVGGIKQPPTPDGTTVVAFDWLPSLPIPALPAPIADLATSLYFSVVTFTTLGYGDLQPASGAAQALATVESFTGALLMALLVFVLGRRATW